MAVTKRYKNMGVRTVRFKIWNDPNMAPSEYEVAPGEECEIPCGYAGNFLKRRAPEFVACDELPAKEEAPKEEAPKEEAPKEEAPKEEAPKELKNPLKSKKKYKKRD